MRGLNKFALKVAAAHMGAFLVTVWYVSSSQDPQASLVWFFWAIVDFPVSFIYLLGGGNYSNLMAEVDDHSHALAQALYLPHLIHGLLGALWWYVLALVFSERRRRSSNNTDHGRVAQLKREE